MKKSFNNSLKFVVYVFSWNWYNRSILCNIYGTESILRTKMCKNFQVKYVIGLKLIWLKWFIEYWLRCQKVVKILESGRIKVQIYRIPQACYTILEIVGWFSMENYFRICLAAISAKLNTFFVIFITFLLNKLSNGATGASFLTESVEFEKSLIGLTKI